MSFDPFGGATNNELDAVAKNTLQALKYLDSRITKLEKLEEKEENENPK